MKPEMEHKKPGLPESAHRRTIQNGPFDGCEPLEERRWLAAILARVAIESPVLGKDGRPILSVRKILVQSGDMARLRPYDTTCKLLALQLCRPEP